MLYEVITYPKDWRGYNNEGMVLAQQMKFAEAKPLFEKAESLAPGEPIIKAFLT